MVIERKYALVEIDKMREMIKIREIHYHLVGNRPYNEVALAASVEDQLRTYMMAGLGSEDLVESCVAADKAVFE